MRKAIIPDFPKKANGLPDLSSVEIELLAEEMAVQFCPDIIENPRPLDMDRFIEQFLGYSLDFLYLSHCQCYLGMTIFHNMKFPVFNMETLRPELICSKENRQDSLSCSPAITKVWINRFSIGRSEGPIGVRISIF